MWSYQKSSNGYWNNFLLTGWRVGQWGCLRHLQISADPNAISNAVQKIGTSKLQKLFGKSRRKKKEKRNLSSKGFHAAGSPVWRSVLVSASRPGPPISRQPLPLVQVSLLPCPCPPPPPFPTSCHPTTSLSLFPGPPQLLVRASLLPRSPIFRWSNYYLLFLINFVRKEARAAPAASVAIDYGFVWNNTYGRGQITIQVVRRMKPAVAAGQGSWAGLVQGPGECKPCSSHFFK